MSVATETTASPPDGSLPTVYIVLLNWNGWRDTLECLSSLDSITYPHWRAIVVDNASLDGSVEQIRRNRPGVTVIEAGDNLGYAAGNNLGIRNALDAGADFVWLLNSDTVVHPEALSAMLAVFAEDESVGSVGSVVRYFDDPETVQVWGGGKIGLFTGSLKTLTSPGRVDYIVGVSLLVRQEALRDVGLLSDRYFMYWEDADFGMRLVRNGWKQKVADDATVLHKGSRSTGGEGSIRAYELFSESSVPFFLRWSRVPFLTLGYRLIGGTIKWAARSEWSRLRVLWSSLARGLRLGKGGSPSTDM